MSPKRTSKQNTSSSLVIPAATHGSPRRCRSCPTCASHSAADHAPAFIAPSPFAAGHYIVVNSGHTFHESEFAAFNYLLFPRLGDWALVKVLSGAEQWKPSSSEFPEEIL